MKLYLPEEKEVVRVDIKGGGGNSACITLIDASIDEAINFVKESLANVGSPGTTSCLTPQSKLRISCYKAIGNKKSHSKSITAYGVTANQVKQILINDITKWKELEKG